MDEKHVIFRYVLLKAVKETLQCFLLPLLKYRDWVCTDIPFVNNFLYRHFDRDCSQLKC